MKVRWVELNRFEAELIVEFTCQPKDAPISASLCRMIYRRLEEQPALAQNRAEIREKE
ncbi:hypothetical protein [Megasphaera massiliensis]|uniref:hypothetical protein n=1 Tax=Megasphaera massiliensis TaxID=1232428 RepID=UPI00259227B6|nr:hypothetical protein [uncultured Megasphaera sp.]